MDLAPGVTVDVMTLELSIVGHGGPLRKPLVEDGRYAEVVVRDVAAAEPGWDAVWVSCWGRTYYAAQPGTAGAEVTLPAWALARLRAIDPNFWAGGVFDVYAWNETTGELRFYELKRKGRDRIRPGQVDFARKALASGAVVTVVEWASPPNRLNETLGGTERSDSL